MHALQSAAGAARSPMLRSAANSSLIRCHSIAKDDWPSRRSTAAVSARHLLGELPPGPGSVYLNLDRPDGIAVITLSSGGTRNAMSPGMMLHFADAVGTLETWSSGRGRGCILTGAGGTFSSGADLSSDTRLFTPPYGAAMSALMSDATARLAALPLVSVAAVEGHAVGGGAELATACDFRVVTPTSKIQFAHAARGLIPGWGGLSRLRAIVGVKNALFICGSAAVMDAEQAARFHLADAILEPSAELSMVEHAIAFLQPMLRHVDLDAPVDAVPLRALKRALLRAGGDGAHRAGEEGEEEHAQFCRLWGSEWQLQRLLNGQAPASSTPR